MSRLTDWHCCKNVLSFFLLYMFPSLSLHPLVTPSRHWLWVWLCDLLCHWDNSKRGRNLKKCLGIRAYSLAALGTLSSPVNEPRIASLIVTDMWSSFLLSPASSQLTSEVKWPNWPEAHVSPGETRRMIHRIELNSYWIKPYVLGFFNIQQ